MLVLLGSVWLHENMISSLGISLSLTQITLKICWESQEKIYLKKQKQKSYCRIIGGYKNQT